MSITLGSNIAGVYVGNSKIVKAYLGSSLVFSAGLPAIAPYTMRFQFYGSDENFDPTSLETEEWEFMGNWTHVSGAIWDFTYQNSKWYGYGYNPKGSAMYLYGVLSMKSKSIYSGRQGDYYRYTNSNDGTTFQTRYVNVLGANLSNVQFIPQLFYRMTHLGTVSLFDTSTIHNASEMFAGNSSNNNGIVTIPNFNFSNVTNERLTFGNVTLSTSTGKQGLKSFAFCAGSLTTVPNLTIPSSSDVSLDNMFQTTRNVESGALSLYNKFSAANWIGTHTYAFSNCGSNTTTGAAELAQIPSSWGGTGA